MWSGSRLRGARAGGDVVLLAAKAPPGERCDGDPWLAAVNRGGVRGERVLAVGGRAGGCGPRRGIRIWATARVGMPRGE